MGAGVVRDFSAAAKERLKDQIKVINEEQWSPVTDFLGDLCYSAQSWLGLLSIDNYISKTEEYHKKVMDQHNTTVSKLEQIFSDVAAVDSEYKESFYNCASQLESHSKSVSRLADMINPAMGILTVSGIKADADNIRNNIEQADAKINTQFDSELKYAEKKALKNTVWDMAGDIVSIAADVVSFGLNVVTGNIPGGVADGWQIINDMFTIQEDVVALGLLGIGLFASGANRNKKRKNILEEAQKAQTTEGLAGVLENNNWNGAAKVARVADTAAAVYGAWEAVKGTYKTAKNVNKYVTDGRYNKVARLSETGLKEVGISTTNQQVKRYENNKKVTKYTEKLFEKEREQLHKQGKYVSKTIRAKQAQRVKEMQKEYRVLSKNKTYVSNIKTTYKYIKAVASGEDNVLKEIVSNTSLYKCADKIVKVIDKGELVCAH